MITGLKVILCGYHWTGCEVLRQLMQRADVSEIALYTHSPQNGVPDIRELAAQNKIWHSEQDISQSDLPFQPDIIASVYYRNIIKQHVIRLANGRIFNVHPSLLPRHRGCSSVPWAIIEGDSITGVTFHYIDERIDTGNIILQAAIEITSDETQSTLFRKCMERAAEFWPAAFELVKARFPGVSPSGKSSYHRRGAPFGGVIGEDWPVDVVERFIRAMIFPPYPCALFRGQQVSSLEEYLLLKVGTNVRDELVVRHSRNC